MVNKSRSSGICRPLGCGVLLADAGAALERQAAVTECFTTKDAEPTLRCASRFRAGQSGVRLLELQVKAVGGMA